MSEWRIGATAPARRERHRPQRAPARVRCAGDEVPRRRPAGAAPTTGAQRSADQRSVRGSGGSRPCMGGDGGKDEVCAANGVSGGATGVGQPTGWRGRAASPRHGALSSAMRLRNRTPKLHEQAGARTRDTRTGVRPFIDRASRNHVRATATNFEARRTSRVCGTWYVLHTTKIRSPIIPGQPPVE